MDDDINDGVLEETIMSEVMQHMAQNEGGSIHPGYVLHNNNTYSPAQWQRIKDRFGRRAMGVRVLRVSDERGRARRDPVRVMQLTVAWLVIGVLLAIVVALGCVLNWIVAGIIALILIAIGVYVI